MSAITCLKNADIVCGRGGLANKHSGNRMFRRIVTENKSIYQNEMNNQRKQLLVASIVMAIQKHGGRFVKRASKTGDSWTEISEKEAKHKTAQALRELDSPSRSSSPTPVFTPLSPKSSSNVDDPVKKSASPIMKPKLSKCSSDESVIIPPEPLSIHEAEKMNAGPDDGLADFLMELLPPITTLAEDHGSYPSQPLSSCYPSGNELIDLIPLDEAQDFAFENNPEYHYLCNGLMSILSA
jgi:hypothetical protein